MVSNSLDLDLDELLAALARLRRDHAGTPEYQELRRDLPAGWPI